ncbi:hypothetical protein O9K51_02658 [Purpureocillium lavendulum]|uniref:Uncharacterized protein n=1 Tax=Purpureocillium lavendulum TaxID=1247861 RepID=A0AB34FY82_9HYPO|nr:hypothetical protein O9K51_02658 [Purpureocillium lavendulum]
MNNRAYRATREKLAPKAAKGRFFANGRTLTRMDGQGKSPEVLKMCCCTDWKPAEADRLATPGSVTLRALDKDFRLYAAEL